MSDPTRRGDSTPIALAAALARERSGRRPLPELAEALFPGQAGPAAEWLAARAEADRAAWFVEAEGLWWRKLTWRLMRPLVVLGVLAAVGFTFQSWVEPTLGFALFALGAGAYYAALQLFAPWWGRKDRRRQQEVEERYQVKVDRLLQGLEDPADPWRR